MNGIFDQNTRSIEYFRMYWMKMKVEKENSIPMHKRKDKKWQEGYRKVLIDSSSVEMKKKKTTKNNKRMKEKKN